MKIYFKRSICLIIALVLAFLFASCNETETPYNTTTVHSCFTTQATERYPTGRTTDPSREGYDIEIIEGKCYIDYDDIAYYLNYPDGYIGFVVFESIDQLKFNLSHNILSKDDLAYFACNAQERTNPIMVIDFNNFYVVKWPKYVTTQNITLGNPKRYNFLSYPISSCIDCYGSYICVKLRSKEDYERGLEAYQRLEEYQRLGTNDERTGKLLECDNKTVCVIADRTTHNDDHFLYHIYVAENGVYYEISASAPKELFTDEFICSIGMEKYEYVP